MLRTQPAVAALLCSMLPAGPLMAATDREIAEPDLLDREFRVFIDDKEVGEHDFRFSGNPDQFELESTADFAYKVAFVTVFSYEHEAQERWQDGCMVALESSTRERGKDLSVTGSTVDGGFSLEGSAEGAGQTHDIDCAWGFAYWTPALRERERLINPQDGRLFEVEWEDLGEQPLSLEGQSVQARAWALRSPGNELDITLYYDPDDCWIGLDSVVGGDRTLRYRTKPSDPYHPG